MGKQYYNGVLYGTGEIIKFSPCIYSLEEREVGVWTDGKPLYEKTWILNYTAHTTAEHNTSIDIHDLNVEVPIAISGFWRRWAGDGKKLYYHWGSGEPTYGQGWARVDSENGYTNGRIAISIKSDGTDYQQVTLQYTKTTDTPGSGHYTTKGGEAHHYSTSEQVIGTWIDGKPLYEKSYVFNNVANAAKNSLGTLTTFDSTWVVRSIDGYAAENDSNGHKNIFVNSEGYTTGNGAFFNVIVNSSNVLRYNLQNRDNLYTSTVYITVKYTKTTD